MAKLKHDIWENPAGLTMLCLSGENGLESRVLLEENSRITYSFYAESHFDAMTKYYQYMNWGIYTTEFEIDKKPYGITE